jgi:hypothetical protein
MAAWKDIALNFAAEWLTFMLPIRKVLGSNLDPKTGYPD